MSRWPAVSRARRIFRNATGRITIPRPIASAARNRRACRSEGVRGGRCPRRAGGATPPEYFENSERRGAGLVRGHAVKRALPDREEPDRAVGALADITHARCLGGADVLNLAQRVTREPRDMVEFQAANQEIALPVG